MRESSSAPSLDGKAGQILVAHQRISGQEGQEADHRAGTGRAGAVRVRVNLAMSAKSVSVSASW